jgi:hypothetical protein
MGVKLAGLEADNFARGAGAVEEEMDVGLAGEIRDGKQSYRGEKLRDKGKAEKFLAVSEHPRDLGLERGHGDGLGD